MTHTVLTHFCVFINIVLARSKELQHHYSPRIGWYAFNPFKLHARILAKMERGQTWSFDMDLLCESHPQSIRGQSLPSWTKSIPHQNTFNQPILFTPITGNTLQLHQKTKHVVYGMSSRVNVSLLAKVIQTLLDVSVWVSSLHLTLPRPRLW